MLRARALPLQDLRPLDKALQVAMVHAVCGDDAMK
jgi:hypothetical protein